MKILFLDFDGVITTYYSRWNIDIEKIKLICEIIESTDAKIVVSSSWKHGSDNVESFKNKILGRRGTNEIKDASPFEKFIRRIYDITDSNGSLRGEEVQRWLDSHSGEVESYVILDDDDDFMESQLFNFVQTDGFEGITSREVRLCIGILNNERIANPIRLNSELTTRWRNMRTGVKSTNIDTLLQEYYNRFKVS